MKNYLKMTRDGFTLVELMIVVAIIGVLASIAVPQYSKFQAKSRQSEVRVQLGGVYTIEQSFAAENSTYTACLGQVGYNRDGTKFYYTVGFASGAIGSACEPGGGTGTCNTYQWSYVTNTSGSSSYSAQATCSTGANTDYFAANIAEPNAVNGVTGQSSLTGTSLNSSAFVIGGAGDIMSKAANVDTWTIDNNKQILNTLSGLN